MTDKLPLLSRNNNKTDAAIRSPDSIEKRVDDGKQHDFEAYNLIIIQRIRP